MRRIVHPVSARRREDIRNFIKRRHSVDGDDVTPLPDHFLFDMYVDRSILKAVGYLTIWASSISKATKQVFGKGASADARVYRFQSISLTTGRYRLSVLLARNDVDCARTPSSQQTLNLLALCQGRPLRHFGKAE